MPGAPRSREVSPGWGRPRAASTRGRSPASRCRRRPGRDPRRPGPAGPTWSAPSRARGRCPCRRRSCDASLSWLVAGVYPWPQLRHVGNLQVAVEPLEQNLEPLHAMRRVPRPRQLVALTGEADELDVAPQEAECREQLLGLLDVAAQVVLRVEDQERRLDLLRIRPRRPLEVRVDVVVHELAEIGLEEPPDVARAVEGDEVVERALGARRPEPIRVADDPRRHEAAVRAAEDAEPLRIDEVEPAQRLVR